MRQSLNLRVPEEQDGQFQNPRLKKMKRLHSLEMQQNQDLFLPFL